MSDPTGEDGDALVAASPASLAVMVADCTPVLLASPEGIIASVHCGWRGLVAGVIPAAVEVMRAQGARRIQSAVGPCIGSECYEFGEEDLERVEAAFGGNRPGVRAAAASGKPALDLRRAVGHLLAAEGVETVYRDGRCTACEASRYYSARARGEAERQAGLIWRKG